MPSTSAALGADAPCVISLSRPSLRSIAVAATLGSTGLLAACMPPPAAMPMVRTAKVDIPSIPLAAVPNLTLDASWFDSAADAACVVGGSAATSDGFFGSELGRWSALRLATEATTLPQQQRLLGNLFTAGFFGGRQFRSTYGSQFDLKSIGPFASISPMAKAASTMVINQLAGQMLATANGDPALVGAAVAAQAPLIAKVLAALDHPAIAMLPPDLQALVSAVREVATVAQSAAAAAAAGDTAAARRVEATVAGVLVWASAFYLGFDGSLPVADPALTC